MNHSFQLHDLKTAPAGSQEALAYIQANQGFLPSLPAAMAESPLALQAFLKGLDFFSKSHFTAMEKEVVFLTIDVENECSYCVAFHSLLATRLNMNPTFLLALRHGENPDDSRLGVLSKMTRELVRQKGKVPETLIQEFLDAGYTRENILEILVAWSSQVISNSVNHLAQVPLDPAFQAFAWTPTNHRS